MIFDCRQILSANDEDLGPTGIVTAHLIDGHYSIQTFINVFGRLDIIKWREGLSSKQMATVKFLLLTNFLADVVGVLGLLSLQSLRVSSKYC